jgi:hypothetical protein
MFAGCIIRGYKKIRSSAQMRSMMAKKLRPAAARPTVPYALPAKLAPKLARVLAYWQSLRRGENTIPFWDDVNLSALPDLSGRLLLVDVFAKPERFRFNHVGQQLGERYGAAIGGKFVDEIEPKNPFEYFASQCSAAIERGAPSYYSHMARAQKPPSPGSYTRLILPMWGDGRTSMLLGAIDWR